MIRVGTGQGTQRLSTSLSLSEVLFRLLALALVDAVAIWLVIRMVADGVWLLVTLVTVITLGLNVIFLREEFYPLRWMSPGLALMILMVVYPLVFTVYTAFTNYSDGHLLTKPQAIKRITTGLQNMYVPEGGITYRWVAFQAEDGTLALWLTDPEGNHYFARPGEPLQPARAGEGIFGPPDEAGVPTAIEGYTRLNRIQAAANRELPSIQFGLPPNAVQVRTPTEAAVLRPRFVYDPERDAIVDQKEGKLYVADDSTGFFVSAEGETLTPGYIVTVGWRNFDRLLNSPAIRGPVIRVFVWTVVFAAASVVTTFALGLFIALLYNDPTVRGRKLIRSLLIVPYAIPAFISILVWRGMMNPQFGVLNRALDTWLGFSPPWFSDPMWARLGVILVNLWLGFPYMMLVCSGALQAIPDDIYEAAEIDGAGAWKKFRLITLPLLLVSVGPLLISSFAFNFNNFNVIYLFNQGNPPMRGTPTPVGHTDILVTYVYRLAFASGGGKDYGYAAAITIIIFLIVAAITLFNFRYTRMWEEVSEHV